jgi:hypothetical protein
MIFHDNTISIILKAHVMAENLFGDIKIASNWMNANNPLFKSYSPLNRIMSGEGYEVIKFLEESLELKEKNGKQQKSTN